MTNHLIPKAIQDLPVLIVPGTRPPEHLISEYNAAYAMWKTVWLETFRELDGTDKIFSDEFVRQDEILCVFKGDVCLASGVMRWVNFDLPSARDDSYFKVWPQAAMAEMGSRGREVIVCSNLSVHPLARGGTLGVALKDVMMALLIERMLESNAHAMTGTMRANRGMHTTTFRLGAKLIIPNLVHHNVPVDLVAFYPDQVHPSTDPVVAAVTEYLWKFKRVHKEREQQILYKVA